MKTLKTKSRFGVHFWSVLLAVAITTMVITGVDMSAKAMDAESPADPATDVIVGTECALSDIEPVLESADIEPVLEIAESGQGSIQIIPTSSTSVANCVPFGNNISYEFTGFIYRDVPPFVLVPGNQIAFDTGRQNDVDIRRNIYFSAANKNPDLVPYRSNVTSQGIMATGWTQVVSDNQIPLNPRGNTVKGDYELVYTAEAGFNFPGGGLIVGFGGSPPGAYADRNCEQVLVYTNGGDASGNFYARFFRKPDQSLGVLDSGSGGTGSSLGGIIIAATRSINQPPVADAGNDLTVEQESYAGTLVTLDGSGSTDPDSTPGTNDDIIFFDWYEATPLGSGETIDYTFPLGIHTVRLVVSDNYGETDDDEVIITVVDTTPPTINCPDDVTVEQESHAGTVVPLQATATDIGDPNLVITSDKLDIYPLGVTTVTFTATDASGNSVSCSMTVTVVDTTAPTINSISASPDTLWSPNHKMVEITVAVDCEDISDSAPVCQIVNVTSNEPINDLGDGNTEADWEITGPYTVNLRAERAGVLTDRIYTIHVECTDASGNTATATVDVTVPHDQGKGEGKK